MSVSPLFNKLNFKEQKEILILNHPIEFEKELKAIENYAIVRSDYGEIKLIEFVLTFVKTKDEINKLIPIIDKKLKGDGIVWYSYPKKTSKKYKSEINRDKGWEILGTLGYECVRSVAIEANWSALRFRKVEFIKTMKRRPEFAKTVEGKQKTKNTNR